MNISQNPIFLLFSLIAPFCQAATDAPARHSLWYLQPADAMGAGDPWMEYALPIGNGQFGAMIYGTLPTEQIQFNEKTLWTGSPTLRGAYQNFGDIFIEDLSPDAVPVSDYDAIDYRRWLDLGTAVAGVDFTSPSDTSVSFSRRYITSYPDGVVAALLTASEPAQISVRLRLRNNIGADSVKVRYDDDAEASFEGKLDLVSYRAKMKAVASGGTVSATDSCITVTGADSLLIVLAGATDFDQHSPTYIGDTSMMHAEVDRRATSAAAKGWSTLLADHLADYTPIYDRMRLTLDEAENTLPTDRLIDRYTQSGFRSAEALMLEELYFHYGRYLLIASSRGVDTPSNLQGIWNHSATPPWESDLHSNINVQMNYWPAEATNLSDLHMPYLNYVHSMAIEHDEWPSYARRSGQPVGWTCFTQNNIFGNSDYAENYVIANAWYTSHLWQHYRYTLDRDFLRDKALPVMISCSRFWLDRLKLDNDGTWVAPLEWSPEQGPQQEDATAHAQQIVTELFGSTLQALDIIGTEPELASQLRERLSSLDRGLATEIYDGKWGNPHNSIAVGDTILREWKTSPYSAGNPGHRHLSHLMCLFPFSQVTPGTPEYRAAINSLLMRGDASTGWSLGWKINLWARALDGDHARHMMKYSLNHSRSYDIDQRYGGVYYNLLDSHAPFQIDGNMGFTSGVAEMLLQSHENMLRLLPALPTAWQAGSATGMRAIGGFEVDQHWRDGHLTEASVLSLAGQPCTINYPGIIHADVTDGSGNPISISTKDTDTITFPTTAGTMYTITL